MTRSIAQPITCPECGETEVTDLWERINVSLDPGLRDEVVSGAVNRFECTSCGFEGQIEKPLLYEDPHRGIALYVAPREWRGENLLEAAARLVGRPLRNQGRSREAGRDVERT